MQKWSILFIAIAVVVGIVAFVLKKRSQKNVKSKPKNKKAN